MTGAAGPGVSSLRLELELEREELGGPSVWALDG